MRSIAIGILALTFAMPLAAALPEVEFDSKHPLRSAARTACSLAPSDGMRDGTLALVPDAYPGTREMVDGIEGDLYDPKAWCRSNADNVGDFVEIGAFVA